MDLPTEDYLAIGPSLKATAAARGITNYGDSRFAVAAFGLVGEDNQVVSPSQAGFIKQASVTLTNAQIIALPTTAIQIIAAQGANTIIVPMFAWLYLHWVADYDNIGDTGRIGIQYGSVGSSGLSSLLESAGNQVSNLLVDGAPHPAFMPLRSAVSSGAAGSITSGIGQFLDDPDTINAVLSLYAVNAGSHTGNYTSGDAGNTLTVSIPYMVFNITTGTFV